jgi:uncharacterized protein YlaI
MKIIREVYLYSDTHLPTHGWLQGCWECETITSRLITYKTVTKGKFTYKFIVYLCPHCKKQINAKEKKEEFNTKCNEFIEDHLETGRS